MLWFQRKKEIMDSLIEMAGIHFDQKVSLDAKPASVKTGRLYSKTVIHRIQFYEI
jgi:hypothetical protein